MSAYQTMEAAHKYVEIQSIALNVLVLMVMFLLLINGHVMVSSS